MKQTINFSDFIDAFHSCDRYDSFGYDALKIIFEYIEQCEDDTGEDLELDVIAICCDYNVNAYDVIAEDYNIDLSEAKGDEKDEEQIVIDYLNDNTIVLGRCKDGIVYKVF